MPKYSWLLFDADGTLFDFAKAEELALRQTVEQSGYPYRNEYLTIFRQVNQQVWEAFEQGRMAHDVLKITRFNRFLDDVQLNGRAEKWSPIYLQYLAQGAYLLDGAEALIRDLASTYRLLIITNGILEVQRSRFGRSSIKPYIDEIIISGEIGVAKPAPEIFDTAFAAMGYPSKAETLIIGDSLSSDMIGGFRYGIDTCWYNPDHQEPPADMTLTYEIHSLATLRDLLLSERN